MSTPVDVHLPESTRSARPSITDVASVDKRTRLERLRERVWTLWRHPRAGLTITAAVAGTWGLVASQWTPRGPLTSGQAVSSMLMAALVGWTAGMATRSRWAMLIAPAAFVVAFEVGRSGTDGPTVDGFHWSEYGVLAFVVGRGFHALLALVPMVWAAAVGAGSARRIAGVTAGRRVFRYGRRAVAIVAGVGLLVLAAGVVRPARTDAIVGGDGRKVAGSVAELTRIDVNGRDLGMMIRGHDVDAPVLLFLAGGPGGAEMGAMRRHLPTLEEHFVVVTFDQRGTGKSYAALDDGSPYTLGSAVDDTLAVTQYLRQRFEQDRIYVLGQSWGSTLGVLAVQERPDLFRAFIGTGQMVDALATDTIFYNDTLAWAREHRNHGLVDRLTAIGPPPYKDMLDYETALSYEYEVYPYDHSTNSEGEGGFSENLFVEEYSLVEQVHLLAGFLDTFSVLYPQLQDIDFRTDATGFEIPVYFVQGAHEAGGRAELFDQWYPTVDAPHKELIVLDNSGHRPLFEQPSEFVEFMAETVLHQTGDGG